MREDYKTQKYQNILNHTPTEEWRLEQKLRIADIMTTRLHLHGEDKASVIFIIQTVKNFRKLCHRCTYEVVIAAICFYVMKTKDSSIKIEKYSVLKEYGLTEKKYITIITHLCNYYQEKVLIRYDKELNKIN